MNKQKNQNFQKIQIKNVKKHILIINPQERRKKYENLYF